MTLVLTDDDVRRVCDMPRIIDAIHDALRVEARGGVQTVPRINFGLSEGFLRLMPAVIEDLDLMGFKAFDAKFPDARYLIAVFRPSTGELDSLVDAAYLTAVRTGATTAVATRLMTGPDDCHEIGVLGSGLEARTNLEALLAVRDVERIRVYSRDPSRRAAFAVEVRERHGIDAVAVDSPQEAAAARCVLAVRRVERVKVFSPNDERRALFARLAIERHGIAAEPVASAADALDASCVLAATNTGRNGPVAVKGRALRDDAHLNTIGATAPWLREVDAETFARAESIVVDTLHAGAECGDIIAAREAGTWDESRVTSLAAVVGAGVPFTRDGGLTVFKSVGTAVQDLAAAAAVTAVARERGLGREQEILSAKTF